MNEEKLILFYYKDGLSKAERREIEAALANDDSLRQRYESLARDLDALSEPEDVPVPEGFEYRLQGRLNRAIRLEETKSLPGGWFHRVFAPRFIAIGASLAAVLAVGVGIGVRIGGEGPPDPQMVIQAPTTTTPEWSQAAFQRGLESHFRSGRSNLEALSPNNGADQASLISTLITQNRLYEKLAEQNDAPEVARVLRSFESTLLQIASEDLTPEEMEELKAKLEFEFSVMLTKLARQASQQTETPNQEI